MIRQKQIDTVAYLKADPLLEGCTIVAATNAHIDSEMDEAISRLGVGIVIEPLEGSIGHTGGHVVTEPTFTITIIENTIMNRGSGGFGKTAEEIMEHVCIRLKPGNEDAPITARSFSLIDDLDEFLTYEVRAVTRGRMEDFNDS